MTLFRSEAELQNMVDRIIVINIDKSKTMRVLKRYGHLLHILPAK